MSDASENPADKPRTWLPLAGAGAAAVVILVVALSTSLFGNQLSDVELATIDVCEAEYARTDGVDIKGGNLYDPVEMRDFYAVAETHGEVPVPLDEVSAAVTREWDAAAEHFLDSGAGQMLMVWRLVDETYIQCAVDVTSAGVDADSVAIGPLVAAGHE